MPSIATVGAMPGIGTQQDALSRRIFWSADHKILAPGGLVIDGTNSRDPSNTGNTDVLQAGLLMGTITASGLYAPSIIGATNAVTNANSATVQVPAAVAAEIVRRIGTTGTFNLIGAAAANAAVTAVNTQTMTFTAINATSGAITVTQAGALAAANGSFIAPTDGSQTPKCLIVKEDGIPVVDRFGASYNAQFPDACVSGAIRSAGIVNYPTDTGLQAWLKSKLRAVGYAFVFSDDF